MDNRARAKRLTEAAKMTSDAALVKAKKEERGRELVSLQKKYEEHYPRPGFASVEEMREWENAKNTYVKEKLKELHPEDSDSEWEKV